MQSSPDWHTPSFPALEAGFAGAFVGTLAPTEGSGFGAALAGAAKPIRPAAAARATVAVTAVRWGGLVRGVLIAGGRLFWGVAPAFWLGGETRRGGGGGLCGGEGNNTSG